MTTTRKKRRRNPVQLTKLIVEIATGQVEDKEEEGSAGRLLKERCRAKETVISPHSERDDTF